MSYVFPAGKVAIEIVDGAVTVTEVTFRPSKGEKWLILCAYAYHDSGANQTLSWKITDGTNALTFTASAAVAAYDKIWINNTRPDVAKDTAGVPNAIILTNSVYATVTADAVPAGKKIYIRGLVLRLGGIYT